MHKEKELDDIILFNSLLQQNRLPYPYDADGAFRIFKKAVFRIKEVARDAIKWLLRFYGGNLSLKLDFMASTNCNLLGCPRDYGNCLLLNANLAFYAFWRSFR